jgi:hypothetical protein
MGKDHLKDLGVDGRTLLRFTFKTQNGLGAWTGLMWLKTETNVGTL